MYRYCILHFFYAADKQHIQQQRHHRFSETGDMDSSNVSTEGAQEKMVQLRPLGAVASSDS